MSSDILQQMRDVLTSAGLVVDAVQADGVLHRCGVAGRERGKDGAYRAHMDAPASLWWRNWRSCDHGTWTATAQTALSGPERKALRERIAQDRAADKEEQKKRWASAAKLAASVWDKAGPAPEAHGYLRRKQVPPLGGLRVACDGRLILPVYDLSKTVTSLQFIVPEKPAHGSDKYFLKGGRTAGGFFPIPAKDGSQNGPLLIAEGYATAASLHLATGHAVLVAFNAGNLEAVARVARDIHPEREIILCADNDCTDKHGNAVPDERNTGAKAATKAAAAIGGKLAICPAHEGRKTDFNDLHSLRGLDAVRAAVAKAQRQSDACPMPAGFYLQAEGKGAGLYKLETRPDGESNQLLLGPPLHVRGMTRDADGNEWGLLLEWKDPDDRPHQWAMPIELLNRQGGEWYGTLSSGGWLGIPGTRSKLAAFLAAVRPVQRIRCVPHVGWHDSVYVLPDAVYGDAGKEQVVLQSAYHTGLYMQAGTLEGWQEVAALCQGNVRLAFALCIAFAGPLLRLAGLEGGGFSFEGGSSSGKTTALQVAASVWGGPEHVRSWRTTDNGLEGIAALHNDGLLILDEVGQVAPRVLSEAAYMLANGQGKGRSARDGRLRRSHAWRLLFLSSGELGLADKLAENGLKSKAGQEVRFVGLPVDKTMLTALHGLPSAGAVVNRLKELTATQYGHAGRAFVQAVVQEQNNVDSLRQSLNQWVEAVCPADADGQVRRVAQRFALCSLAGDVAEQAGILPQGFAARACTEQCFHDWLDARGGSGASEDAAILSAVRLFIEQHGASRFQNMENDAATCINRVGFRQKVDGMTEYVILPEAFKAEVIKGFSERRATRVLAEAGWLQLERPGRMKSRLTLPDLGRVECYRIKLD